MKKFYISAASVALVFVASTAYSLGYESARRAAAQSADDTIETPTMEEIPAKTADADFSSLANSLIDSGELCFRSLSLDFSSPSIKPIRLEITDLDIDKSGANELNFSISAGNIDVYYSNTKQASLSLTYSSDNVLYLSYLKNNEGKANALSLRIPRTIDSIVTMLKAIGITMPSLTSNTDISLEDILTEVKGNISNIGTSRMADGFSYQAEAPEMTFGETRITPLSFRLSADSSNAFTGIEITPFTIETPSSEMTIGLKASGYVNARSSYSKDVHGFEDMTEDAGSVLATLAKMADSKVARFDISADATINNEDGSKNFAFDGALLADSSTTFMDYSASEYYLELNHRNGTSLLNTVKTHYRDDTVYLSLNNLFKGYLAKADIKDVFTYMDTVIDDSGSLTHGQRAFSSVTDILNVVLEKSDTSSLMSGMLDDLSLGDNVRSFTYRPGSYFELVVNAQAFALDDYDITIRADLTATTDETGKTATSLATLSVSNIHVSDIVLNTVSFSPKAITKEDFREALVPQIDDEVNYQSYQGSVPLFETLADLAGKRTIAADLTLLANDKANKATYSADLAIVADLRDIKADDSLDIKTVDGLVSHFNAGRYHVGLTLDSQNETAKLAHDFGIDYQNGNLFASYKYDENTDDYVFRQYMPDSQIADIKTMIDALPKKEKATTEEAATSSEDTSRSLDDVSRVLAHMKANDNYRKLKDGLKSGSLLGLESYVTLNANGSILEVTIDPDAFFGEGDAYRGHFSTMMLTVDPTTKDILSVSFHGNYLSFDLTLSDDISALKVLPSRDEEIQALGYQKVNHANYLVGAFASLPTDLEKFGLTIDAAINIYNDDDTLSNAIVIQNSALRVDASDGFSKAAMKGVVNITHDSLFNKDTRATQKLEFAYNQSVNGTDYKDQILAEYNDKMTMKLSKSTIAGADDSLLSQLKDIPKANLLNRYLSRLNSTSTGLPLLDVIKSKDPSILLTYRYIRKVTISDDAMTVLIDRHLFDETDVSGETDTVTVRYSGNGDNAQVDGMSIQGQYRKIAIDVTVALKDYNEATVADDVSFGKNNIIDLNGFRTLTTCLIDTTDNNYFEFKESDLKLNIPILSDKVIGVYGQVFVADDHAYAYLRFKEGGNSKTISDNAFYVTEVFIVENMVWFSNTRVTMTSGFIGIGKKKDKVQNEVYKITQEELTSNIPYYLLQVICHLTDSIYKKVMNSIYDSANSNKDSDVKISDDLSGAVSSADYQDGMFRLVVNPANFITIPMVSVNPTTVTVRYQTGGKDHRFTSISLSTGLSVISLLNITVDNFTVNLSCENIALDETGVIAGGGKMDRFYRFMSEWQKQYSVYSGMDFQSLSNTFNDDSILGFYEVHPTSVDKTNGNGNNRITSVNYSDYSSTNQLYYHA